jgi:PRTRC genetic system protein F
MLFDPAPYGLGVADQTGLAWESKRPAVTRRRSAVDLLTLPAVSSEVPATAFLKWRDPAQLTETIERHFRYGPLRAYDVRNPISAADAFQQAFFAWWGRQSKAPFKRLTFVPVLMDSAAVVETLQFTDDEDNSGDPAPLFLAIEVPDENCYELSPGAGELRAAHPMLMRSVMETIRNASNRTLFLRDPEWFWTEYEVWYFDGDLPTDEEAREHLAERFDAADEVENYLPSAVRRELAPEDVFFTGEGKDAKAFYKGALKGAELMRLRNRLKGRARRVCTALMELQSLIAYCPKRNLMQFKYFSRNAYEACSLVWEHNRFTEEFVDIHFDDCGSNGATTYPGFTAFETKARSIRTQYEKWARAIRILQSLDTLLSLVSR